MPENLKYSFSGVQWPVGCLGAHGATAREASTLFRIFDDRPKPYGRFNRTGGLFLLGYVGTGNFRVYMYQAWNALHTF